MLSLILALLYPVAIMANRGGLWLLVAPVTVVALVIDVIANYTELALLTLDVPQRGEYTFSQRLVRLQDGNLWQRIVAKIVIPYLNYFDPGHVPVKAN